MRRCKECEEEKNLNDFYKNKSSKGGYNSKCKECVKKRVALYRKNNPEKTNESRKKAMGKNLEYYKEWRKHYYELNRDVLLEQQKEYQRKFKEHKRRYDRDYRSKNKEQYKLKKKKYYLENPEIFRSLRLKRKSLVRQIEHTLTTEELVLITRKFDNRCALSGDEIEHFDHFIPVCTGCGGTTKENVIPLSAELNLSKGPKNPFEWIKERDDISIERFDYVVNYLARLNSMSYQEYKDYVYKCFENTKGSI